MNTKIIYTLKDESGIAAFIALMLVILLTGVGILAIRNSNDEIALAGNERDLTKAFYAAEAGLEQATAAIQTEFELTNAPPLVMPVGSVSMPDATVSYVTTDDGAAVNRSITTGSMIGLNALVKTFTVDATGTNSSGGKIELSEQFEVSLIPLFQFAIFYENDLELHPGPNMTLTGRVHSNGDIYFGANSGLNIDSWVTAAGGLYHGRHPAAGGISTGSGQVQIKDASGVYQGMYQGGSWLDATSSNWYDSSVARWGGRVQDGSYGQQKLSMPLAGVDDPHKIIEPSNGGSNPDSFEEKATLKIMNQQVLQKVGSVWLDRTATAVSEGWFSATDNAFTDYRENKGVDAVEIDMGAFKSSSIFPDNGVVYVSDDDASRDFPALQLKNGSDIGAPINFVSENPIYIEGDFNTVNKQPAAVMGDAVTFLSNNWDINKGQTNKNNRVADPTTVNVSFVTGNVPSNGGTYSGGAENLPRFLEKWSGKSFTWRGSMVNMWESVQATTPWSGGHYSPPIRDWGFDPDLNDPNNLPPETPRARNFARIGWKQKDIEFADVEDEDTN